MIEIEIFYRGYAKPHTDGLGGYGSVRGREDPERGMAGVTIDREPSSTGGGMAQLQKQLASGQPTPTQNSGKQTKRPFKYFTTYVGNNLFVASLLINYQIFLLFSGISKRGLKWAGSFVLCSCYTQHTGR